MRVRIKLDVKKPLKRRKKIIKKDGIVIVVDCKYERLGEFCFTCGLVSHTDRFCRISIDRGEEVVEKDWGSCLRAPPRRVASQSQSKWLRAENDDTWEDKIGGDRKEQQFSGENFQNQGMAGNTERDMRMTMVTKFRNNSKESMTVNAAHLKGFKSTSNLFFESNEGELNAFQLEDLRKRMRRLADEVDQMDMELGQQAITGQTSKQHSEADISNADLSDSIHNISAELARQASHAL